MPKTEKIRKRNSLRKSQFGFYKMCGSAIHDSYREKLVGIRPGRKGSKIANAKLQELRDVGIIDKKTS